MPNLNKSTPRTSFCIGLKSIIEMDMLNVNTSTRAIVSLDWIDK